MIRRAIVLWRPAFSRSKTIKGRWLKVLLVGLLLAASKEARAQEGGWSTPVMISVNTVTSWFSDVAVDDWGQPHVVYTSGRMMEEVLADLLMYSTPIDEGWLEPNDIVLTAHGGYTIRPAITTDHAATLHMTFRGGTRIYYTHAPASEGWNASAWSPRRVISGGGVAYYSDVAVDERGGIHIIWNESVSAGTEEKWLWFGTLHGVALHDGRGWQSQEPQSGLSRRAVYAMIEDDAGVQWFGTDEGVYRFDGSTWRRLTVEDGLVGQKVNCVAQDTDGTLWFGTDAGVSLYNEKADKDQGESKWTRYAFGTGLPDNTVHAIAPDLEGVWVGTAQGLARYDGKDWVSYTSQDGLIPDEVLALAVDSHGGVWVGNRRGASYYDGGWWTAYTVESGLVSNVITAIAVDQRDTVWFGAEKGLSRFDGEEWTSYTADDGLEGDAVTALMVDRWGTVWVGTEGGVSRYDGQTWESFELPDELAGQAVTSIAEDRRVNAICPLCADIFYRRSTDGGKTWSAPVNLSNSFAGSVKPQLRVDDGGHVYVTWEEGEDWYVHEGYPIGSMFAHSPDGGHTWMEPIFFSPPAGTPQQITLGVGKEGQLIVVWRLPREKVFYYQLSADRGITWSEPEPIPGVIAKPWGPFSLDGYDAATDGADQVHLLVLGRLTPLTQEMGLIHLVWNGSDWSPPNLIYSSRDWPEWPRIDVGAGNKVHASWFTRDAKHLVDAEGARFKIWASSYQSSAPPQTPPPLPTPTPAPSSEPLGHTTADVNVTPTPVAVPVTSGLPPGLDEESDEIGQLIVALAPAVAVLLCVVALRLRRLARR